MTREEMIARLTAKIKTMSAEEITQFLAEIAAMEAEKRAGQGSAHAASKNG